MFVILPGVCALAGMYIIALISLILPPAADDGSIAFSRELIRSDSYVLKLLGAVLYLAQSIDIRLFALCMNALKFLKALIPFGFIYLLWKLFTL